MKENIDYNSNTMMTDSKLLLKQIYRRLFIKTHYKRFDKIKIKTKILNTFFVATFRLHKIEKILLVFACIYTRRY